MDKELNELVSIIVPIYNVEAYLEKCIKSIIEQSYKNIEIILVDDGSPDRCPAICDDYAHRDDRIKVIHKKNGGLSDARNAGIDLAKGSYIAFVDSDDYIASNFVEALLDAVIESNCQLSICNVSRVDEYGNVLAKNSSSQISNEVITGIDALNRLALPINWFYVVAWNKLYARSLFETVRFPIGKIHEDEYVIHYIFCQCKAVACISDSLYFYTQRPSSITGSRTHVNSLYEVEALIDRAGLSYNLGLKEFAGECFFGAASLFCRTIGKINLEENKERVKELYASIRKNAKYIQGASKREKIHFALMRFDYRLYNKLYNLRNGNR